MCDYTQREFSCGHFLWLASKHWRHTPRGIGQRCTVTRHDTCSEEKRNQQQQKAAVRKAWFPAVGPSRPLGSHLWGVEQPERGTDQLSPAHCPTNRFVTGRLHKAATSEMPTTMTKLPSDSFWPLGLHDSETHVPFPKLTSDSSSSIISPLTLPRGIAGYFDYGSGPHQPHGQVYSPLSAGARGPALHSASFLSPYLHPSTKQGQLQFDQHRSSSLPPKSRNGITSSRGVGNGLRPGQESAVGPTSNGLSPVVDGPMSPVSGASTANPRSISADAVSAPAHAQMVQRLVQQNARIREAWEAERKYLEANRERAEEVYKEERVFMDEERAEWDAEKAVLLQTIKQLQQALALNGMPSLLRTPSSNVNQRGGTQGSSRVSPNSSLSSQRSSQPRAQHGAPLVRNGDSSSPMTGPRTLDLSSPRSPNGPSAPTLDFLKPAEASESETDPVPIVDVHEIHPELEGIPIKATSVKKATFTDTGSHNGSKTSSRSGSPPASSDQSKGPRVKKEQTLQVLAAKEVERLTMHAGHTPSHSLSSLATAASSGTATATSNGGDSTPTMPHEDRAFNRDIATSGPGDGVLEAAHTADSFPGVTDRHGHLLDDHPEPVFEPSEDRELKGPLMVRNMPAHDEIFFQKLSDKLEEVYKDNEAALPAVLKDTELAKTIREAAEQSKPQAEGRSDSQQQTAESDAGSESSPRSGDEEEFEVPLKFKKRMNFGAPFGEFR
ncbi:hypothetical protein C8A00DRAFT_47211 [Chaetomidium leptoderma]|uniref:Uncharacterized protein n=1 Tax=Chaetomidium leptoderma TaxID=669021 RepID=A0AAN6ZSB4_9PEZI|nr:hypothetical protein C8A00DRAFT_47211 [Chaetomidium leptoderma]